MRKGYPHQQHIRIKPRNVAFGFGFLIVTILVTFTLRTHSVPQQPIEGYMTSPRPNLVTLQVPSSPVHQSESPAGIPSRSPQRQPQRTEATTPTTEGFNFRAGLECEYPVHRKLPAPGRLHEGLETQFAKSAASCADIHIPPIPPTPPSHPRTRQPPPGIDIEKLQSEFRFRSQLKPEEYFLDPLYRETLQGGDASSIWWIAKEGNLPCTAEAQMALFQHQNPSNCDTAKFLSARLKEGAHGLGSALSIVVYDFLSAVMTDRVLVVEQGSWNFASGACHSASWGCYFSPPTSCPTPHNIPPVTIHNYDDAKHSKAKVIKKKELDIRGLGRNDVPDIKTFLKGGTCPELEPWLKDPQNVYLMGTFARGADPYLTWLMAQVLRFLMRRPQPWFSEMLRQNLNGIGYPGKWGGGGVAFLQLRGEIAKFREYYNVFGCHDVHIDAYVNVSTQLIQSTQGVLFISGNTPRNKYTHLLSEAASTLSSGHRGVFSTWNHSAMNTPKGGGGETARWGADLLMASWLDLVAGMASTAWVCIIQSNWCRMINFMRLTAGRADCPFVDLGLMMLSDVKLRKQYCVTKSEWPTKPFSGCIKRQK
eukprot:PhF_6_TR33665/c0_g1_i1/m.49274/K00717/FUT8; glycoprotein 6-alpha-L-fucosyltransferase